MLSAPRPIADLPTQLPDPSLGTGFLNYPSEEGRTRFANSVNNLARIFGLSSVKSSFIDEILKFFGDSVKDKLDTGDAVDTKARLKIFADAKAGGVPNVPGHLKTRNLQNILNGKGYKGLSTYDGIALLQAIKAAIEQMDASSAEILKWQKDNDCSWLRDFGSYNSTLLSFLMEIMQDVPSQVKGMFTSGSDFHTWAMQTADSYGKKDSSFDVSAFKNAWNALAAKVDSWGNIDSKQLQSFISKPMIESTFVVRLDNQMKNVRHKVKVKKWKAKKTEEKDKKRMDKIIEAKQAANARARKAELDKAAQARKKSAAKKTK